MNVIREFIEYYKPYKKIFFLDLLFATIIAVVNLAFPQILRMIIKIIVYEKSEFFMPKIFLIGIVMFLGYILQTYSKYYVSCQGHVMGAYMERDMRRNLFNHYQKLSFSYYDKTNTGQMMSKIVSDLFDISEMAHHGPENLFIASISLIGAFAFLIFINLKLTIVLVMITILMILFTVSQHKRMKKTFADNREKIGNINETLQDSLSGIKVVQSFANEKIEEEKFNTGNENFLSSKKDNYHAMGIFQAGNTFFQGLIYLSVLTYGSYLVHLGEISAINLGIYALYISVFISPIVILVELTEMLQKGFAGFKRYSDIMKVLPEIKNKLEAEDVVDASGDIEFKDVTFSYDEKETVLEDISITMKSGKSIALVGPSGGGKTTLCSLIPRFYELKRGNIFISNQDIKDMKIEELRKSIGIVQQDVYLFGGTIRENILYGKIGASEEEMVKAAKNANIHEFIMSLPEQYDTIVGPRGARLSGGQKQRISIARLFLKNPPILILDEATSALDNESEKHIQKSLNHLAKNRTTITIAHRLSTIKNADEIIVIEKKKIIEKGSHQELIKANGTYAKYYNMQFEGLDVRKDD